MEYRLQGNKENFLLVFPQKEKKNVLLVLNREITVKLKYCYTLKTSSSLGKRVLIFVYITMEQYTIKLSLLLTLLLTFLQKNTFINIKLNKYKLDTQNVFNFNE